MMALDQVSLRSAKAPRALSLLAFDGVLTMRGKAQATLVLEEAILDIVEERAPITVRVASAYALFVRERRQCARREPSGL